MAEPVPPISPDEVQRLQALRQYRILDTEPEPVFDNITRLAALICDVPMVVITLIDEKRQWFKSRVGLTITESPRDIAFCSHTVALKKLFVIPDAIEDTRFRNNPLVQGDPHVRFYAGAPLISPNGFAVGALAVLDRIPRKLNTSQSESLELLARQVMEQLELGRRAAETLGTLQATVNASPIAVVALDLKGKVVLWNDQAEKIFGYTRDEVIGKLMPTIPPEEWGTFLEITDRLTKGEPLLRYENRKGLHKDGRLIDTTISISAVHNEKGDLIGSVGMLEDITERKRIEHNLISLGTIVESSGDAIIGGTLDGIVTAWNKGAERLFGYTAEEMTGQSITAIYPSDRINERIHIVETLKRAESISNMETVRIKKDGAPVSVSVTISAVKDERGNPIGVSSVARDITERKRAERELQHSLSLLKATLEATADGIIALDRKGKVVSVNQRFAELWRLPKEIVDTADLKRGLEFAATQLVDPEYFLEKSCRYFAGVELEPYDLVEFKDGRMLERYIHPQLLGNETVGYVFSYRDVTRRRQLEEQLRQAQKMEAVGQLAGGIAHDFNNLLNVIIGYTELIKMSLPAEDPLRTNAEQIMKAAERAAALTRQLLVFSRKQVPHYEVLDVNTIVSNMSVMLKRVIGEDIELAMSLQPNLGNIKADASQLEQIVMNLVINARDAMPNGGKIEIGTSHQSIERISPETLNLIPGDYFVLDVRDNGIGMTDEIKAHIFEPFFTTKEPGKGTGLGLATVYGIVHQNGGEIEVKSASGKGSSFRVFLPAAQQNHRDESLRQKTLPTEGREVILLVEDEESLRKLISQALRAQGYTVLEAKDGTTGVETALIHEGKLDMLITDIVMPGMRGWELARKVTAKWPEIRVLYISGYSDKGLLDPDVLGPNSAFLQKPFSPSTLAQKVRSFLG